MAGDQQLGSITANIGWYVVSEKWHHFWELPNTNLLGLFEVAGRNTIFPILSNKLQQIHLFFINSDSKVIIRCKMPRSHRFLLLCLVLYVTRRIKRVSGLSTPATGRTSWTVILSRSSIVGIGKSLDVLWFHLRCLHGNNSCFSKWSGIYQLTGFDCDSFNSLLVKFGPMFDGHTHFDESGMIVEFEYISSKKRVVQLADCCGLALVWTCGTRGPLNVLHLVFRLI